MKKSVFLLMLAFCLNLVANDGNNRITILEGTVYDENEKPLTGAIISIMDGKYATMSDINGKYSLNTKDGDNIPDNKKIKISVKSIGYESQMIMINTKKDEALNIDFILNENKRILINEITPKDFKYYPLPSPTPKEQIREMPNPKFILCK